VLPLLGTCGAAHADVPELGGTLWFTVDDAVNDRCSLDEIAFSSDGSAAVYGFMEEDPDAASWTLDGASLKLTYDDWPGDLSGTLAADRFEAMDTWQSARTNEVHHDVCIFERR
jgi:hypothetical protein